MYTVCDTGEGRVRSTEFTNCLKGDSEQLLTESYSTACENSYVTSSVALKDLSKVWEKKQDVGDIIITQSGHLSLGFATADLSQKA